MIHIRETLRTPEVDTYRANRVRSMFNVEPSAASECVVAVDLPIDEKPWRLGLVVGPSGSGKTTIGRKILGDGAMHQGFDWSRNAPIVDEIGAGATFADVTGALSSVGLGTVPSWLRPFAVLSNGERFRAELARLIVERPARVVVDEFTSVVDRQVAQVGAAAFAKAWRRGTDDARAVLLSCHHDIVEWLQPDWLLDTREWQFGWRSVQRPPAIELDVFRTDWNAWRFFEAHHYMKAGPMFAAFPYVATVRGEPVAFCAVTTQVGFHSARMARIVVMPEWQGAGVGMRFIGCVADDWLRGNNRYGHPMSARVSTSHPGLIAAMSRSAAWAFVASRLLGAPSHHADEGSRIQGHYGGHLRATATFAYVGTPTGEPS